MSILSGPDLPRYKISGIRPVPLTLFIHLEGNIVTHVTQMAAAGNDYGFRYDQLVLFLARERRSKLPGLKR